MRLRIAAISVLLTTTMAEAQAEPPSLLPKLIGMSIFDFEAEFGSPSKACNLGPPMICEYRWQNGKLHAWYKGAEIVQIVWFPPKGTRALTIEALAFGHPCKVQETDKGTGSDVFRGCPGGLMVDIGNLKSGDVFNLTVSREQSQ